MNGIKKRAFTLAELLIVLGIIGIIAALTMPALIANHKKQVTVTKLKKTVSILNQAFKLAEAEHGDYENWDDGWELGAEAYFDKYWRPHLQIVKECKTYQQCGYKKNNYNHLNGTESGTNIFSDNHRKNIILSDGILVNIFVSSTSSAINYIFIDINADGGPNVFGKDVFCFSRTEQGILPYGYNNIDASVNLDCSKTGNGYYCAAKIMRDGWQIKDDYPW